MNMSGFRPRHFNGRAEGKVVFITMLRPERKNPMTFESYAEMRDTFRQIDEADDIIGPLLDKGMKGLLAFTTVCTPAIRSRRCIATSGRFAFTKARPMCRKSSLPGPF